MQANGTEGVPGEDLMRTVVAAFEKSDIRPLLDALHPDVVWRSASTQNGLFSFQGEYRNRAGVLEVLSNISKDYTFHHMRPKEIVSAGEVVWGYFEVGLLFDAKGRSSETKDIQIDMVIRWRLQDGKIIEHRAFFDTAYLAQVINEGR